SLSPSLSFPLSTFIFLSLSIALYSLGFHVSSVFYFLSLSLFHFPRFTPSCSSFHRSPSLSLPLSPSPSPSLALSLSLPPSALPLPPPPSSPPSLSPSLSLGCVFLLSVLPVMSFIMMLICIAVSIVVSVFWCQGLSFQASACVYMFVCACVYMFVCACEWRTHVCVLGWWCVESLVRGSVKTSSLQSRLT